MKENFISLFNKYPCIMWKVLGLLKYVFKGLLNQCNVLKILKKLFIQCSVHEAYRYSQSGLQLEPGAPEIMDVNFKYFISENYPKVP